MNQFIFLLEEKNDLFVFKLFCLAGGQGKRIEGFLF